jgi:hypothetical protein
MAEEQKTTPPFSIADSVAYLRTFLHSDPAVARSISDLLDRRGSELDDAIALLAHEVSNKPYNPGHRNIRDLREFVASYTNELHIVLVKLSDIVDCVLDGTVDDIDDIDSGFPGHPHLCMHSNGPPVYTDCISDFKSLLQHESGKASHMASVLEELAQKKEQEQKENPTYDDMLRLFREKQSKFDKVEDELHDARTELRWAKEDVTKRLLKAYCALLADKGFLEAFWGDLGLLLGQSRLETWSYALAMRPIMLVMPVRRTELIDRATPLFKSLLTKDEYLPPDYLADLRVYLKGLEETLDELEFP